MHDAYSYLFHDFRPEIYVSIFTEVEVNNTWLITSELAHQRACKVPYSLVWYILINN